MESDPKQSPGPDSALKLDSKTVTVLEMIANGHSYEQILQTYPALTYRDIFAAAAEALDKVSRDGPTRLAQIRERYPRAYEKWTAEEEAQLRQLLSDGDTVAQIAGRLQRQRGAISSRIIRLGLFEKLGDKEQERLRRIAERHEKHLAPLLNRRDQREP